jgi:AhpD family alkylhydroperoxidase
MPAEQAWKDDVQKMAESARKAASQKDEPEAQAAERRTPEATSPGGATPEATTPVTTAEQAKEQIRSMLGTVPVMFERFPDEGLAGAWVEMRDLEMSAKTALSPKVKTLIGLAVSAQIPCTYCVQAHTEFAKAFGASERERDEAVAMASIVRHWSTIANGMQIERESFDKDVSKMVDALKKGTVVEQEKYDEE